MRSWQAAVLLALAVGMVLVSLPAPSQGLATVQPGEPPVAWVVPNPLAAQATAEDRLYAVVRDAAGGGAVLRAYDRTGAVAWSQELAGTSFASVGASGASWTDQDGILHDVGRVLVRDASGVLQMRRDTDGSLLWSRDLGPLPASHLGAPPILDGGRVLAWVQAPDGLRVRALDPATGNHVWDSRAWPVESVVPRLASDAWGVYVTSALPDGAMWQLTHPDGTVRRGWSHPGSYTSVPATQPGGLADTYVSLVDPGDAATPTKWIVQRRTADDGNAVWFAVLEESGAVACCEHIAPPYPDGGRVLVPQQTAVTRLGSEDGRFLARTPAQGPVWSDYMGFGIVARGPSGALPAHLDALRPDTGERMYRLPLDLQQRPAGGVQVQAFGGNLMAVQALPERLLDTLSAGTFAVHGWFPIAPPTWEVAAGEDVLSVDGTTRTLAFAPVRSYNPATVTVQRRAPDGAWEYAGEVADPDLGGDGSRTWHVDARESGSYRVIGRDRVGQVTAPSNTVTVAAAPHPTGSSSTITGHGPNAGSASAGSGSSTQTGDGGSRSTPTASPDWSGGQGGSSSGRTYTAAPGRLVVDTPTANATLSGEVVLRGRMVDASLLGETHWVQAVALRGNQVRSVGEGVVTLDGTWSVAWDTAAPQGGRLLEDGPWDVYLSGVGSDLTIPYRLENGHWLRTARANVTFEDAGVGAVWVNVTWQGNAGFTPETVSVTLSDPGSVQHIDVTVAALPDGSYAFAFTQRIRADEEQPLDVAVAFTNADGGTVVEDLARRPAAGTSVMYRTPSRGEWAAPAAGLAATGFLAAAIASTEVGRFWALRLLPVALFTRVRGGQVLENRRREQLVVLVEARPGIAMRELADLSGVRGGALSHHLATLEREGLLRRQRVGLRMTFHPAGGSSVARQLPALQASLLRLVAAQTLNQSDAARQLAVSRQALHYHVGQLHKAGLLDLIREGRTTLLRIPLAARSRVWTCAGCRSLLEGERGPRTRCQACGAPQGTTPPGQSPMPGAVPAS